jgi:hypothetical protein
LRFTAGAQDLDLVADEAIEDLCHARFAGSPPLITTRAGMIRVRYPRVLPWPLRSKAAIMRLNPILPWDVEIHGGAQRLTADLRRTELTRLAVHGGASHVTLELPSPRGTVSMRFAKGVHQLTIVRPCDTAARVSVHRGTSDAHLDDQAFGVVGGPCTGRPPTTPPQPTVTTSPSAAALAASPWRWRRDAPCRRCGRRLAPAAVLQQSRCP